MKKSKQEITFVCNECGYESLKWLGKCPECGSWNSFKEFNPVSEKGVKITEFSSEVVQLDKVDIEKTVSRIVTKINEFDRTLGGGIVNGSVILLGGEPGIGKSTLVLQIAEKIAESGYKVLYVSGEESLQQVKLRADRLGIKNKKYWSSCDNLLVAKQYIANKKTNERDSSANLE